MASDLARRCAIRRSGGLRGLALIAACAVVSVLLTMAQVGPAPAHASMVSSAPGDGEVLDNSPSIYRISFSEPVSPISLMLTKPDGSFVALRDFVLRDRTLEVTAPSDLGRGTYMLSWRVVSEDGHPIGGSVAFSVGQVGLGPRPEEERVDWFVSTGIWLSKVSLYIGLFIGVGGAFAFRVLMPAIGNGGRVILAALVLGAAGTVVSTGFQGLDVLGVALTRIIEPAVWASGLGTSYARTVAVALAAFALASIAMMGPQRLRRPASVCALFAAGIALSLSGHAGAASPQWLTRPAVFVHASTIAAWSGALIPLGVALHRRDAGAISSLRRFSKLIPYILALLVVAGVVSAVVQVERPGALLTTAYGKVLLVKLGLIAGLLAMAATNRWFLTSRTEAGDAAATRGLVLMIAAEILAVLLVFGVGAAWRFTPPPRALAVAADQPVAERFHSDKAIARIEIAPGRAGSVDVSVNLLTHSLQLFAAEEVSLVLSNASAGIEPFERRLARQEEAVWVAGLTIPVAGRWRIRIDMLVNDFELIRLDGEINIRP